MARGVIQRARHGGSGRQPDLERKSPLRQCIYDLNLEVRRLHASAVYFLRALREGIDDGGA